MADKKTEQEIHDMLKDDLAYQHSVATRDPFNMRMVLRAHNLPFDFDTAQHQTEWAAIYGDDPEA